MAYRRSRAEIIAAACVPPLTEETSKLYARIIYRHPVGPWTVSIFEPEDRKLVGRRHFGWDQLPLLWAWLGQVQTQFNSVQWFVLSKKDARPLMPADLDKLLFELAKENATYVVSLLNGQAWVERKHFDTGSYGQALAWVTAKYREGLYWTVEVKTPSANSKPSGKVMRANGEVR